MVLINTEGRQVPALTVPRSGPFPPPAGVRSHTTATIDHRQKVQVCPSAPARFARSPSASPSLSTSPPDALWTAAVCHTPQFDAHACTVSVLQICCCSNHFVKSGCDWGVLGQGFFVLATRRCCCLMSSTLWSRPGCIPVGGAQFSLLHAAACRVGMGAHACVCEAIVVCSSPDRCAPAL